MGHFSSKKWVKSFQKQHLPESIGSIEELETLLLEGNNICDLPSLESHDMLIKLNLNDNNLSKIDFDISELEDLQLLSLDNNNLEYLPDSICKLEKLNYLSVSANKLKELPSCIGELKNLLELDIDENEIKEFPESFYELTKLKNLYIDDNQGLEKPNLKSLEFCDV